MSETEVNTGAKSSRSTKKQRGGPSRDDLGTVGDFIVPLCSVFRRHLKAEKQKFTPERAQVLDAIIQLDRVFEAEELLFELRDRGMKVSKATIYRTLKLLIEAGIIEQVLYDQKQAHYRLGYERAPQGQLICVETGRVIEFSAPELLELRDRIAREHG